MELELILEEMLEDEDEERTKKQRRGIIGEEQAAAVAKKQRRGRICGEEATATKEAAAAAKKQRRGRICGEEATATKEAAATNGWWRRNSGGEGSSGREGWVEEGRDGIQMNPICFGGIRLSHVVRKMSAFIRKKGFGLTHQAKEVV
ncbi:hypothetical protein LWI29_001758 [Acer saccharum]|uniref:Uncharacterized protein n=1 Tax=Acer saccharum TaxID=4024 RepID=A0AA39RK87_ACESA|nr:hypothetical protein LWI29_001758 [Acer saccharum]